MLRSEVLEEGFPSQAEIEAQSTQNSQAQPFALHVVLQHRVAEVRKVGRPPIGAVYRSAVVGVVLGKLGMEDGRVVEYLLEIPGVLRELAVIVAARVFLGARERKLRLSRLIEEPPGFRPHTGDEIVCDTMPYHLKETELVRGAADESSGMGYRLGVTVRKRRHID